MSENKMYVINAKNIKCGEIDDISDICETSKVIERKELGAGSELVILEDSDGSRLLVICCNDGSYYYSKVEITE